MKVSEEGFKEISIELFVALSWTGRNGTDMIGGDYGYYLLNNFEEKFDGETGEFFRETKISDLFHE